MNSFRALVSNFLEKVNNKNVETEGGHTKSGTAHFKIKNCFNLCVTYIDFKLQLC